MKATKQNKTKQVVPSPPSASSLVGDLPSVSDIRIVYMVITIRRKAIYKHKRYTLYVQYTDTLEDTHSKPRAL